MLEILEPHESELLGIPKSLSGSQEAYERMKEKSLFTTLDEARKYLIGKHNRNSISSVMLFQEYCDKHNFASLDDDRSVPVKTRKKNVWTTNVGKLECNYHPIVNKKFSVGSFNDVQSIKFKWGEINEATGILLAINYFSTHFRSWKASSETYRKNHN